MTITSSVRMESWDVSIETYSDPKDWLVQSVEGLLEQAEGSQWTMTIKVEKSGEYSVVRATAYWPIAETT